MHGKTVAKTVAATVADIFIHPVALGVLERPKGDSRLFFWFLATQLAHVCLASYWEHLATSRFCDEQVSIFFSRQQTCANRLTHPRPGRDVPVGLRLLIGPILWGHSGPLCHALSLSLLLLSLSWTSMRRRRAIVATRGEWQFKTARSGEWAQHFSNVSCSSKWRWDMNKK